MHKLYDFLERHRIFKLTEQRFKRQTNEGRYVSLIIGINCSKHTARHSLGFMKNRYSVSTQCGEKAVRVISKIPYRSHNYLLPSFCEELLIYIQFHKRFITFSHQIMKSDNTIVYTCGLQVPEGSKGHLIFIIVFLLNTG